MLMSPKIPERGFSGPPGREEESVETIPEAAMDVKVLCIAFTQDFACGTDSGCWVFESEILRKVTAEKVDGGVSLIDLQLPPRLIAGVRAAHPTEVQVWDGSWKASAAVSSPVVGVRVSGRLLFVLERTGLVVFENVGSYFICYNQAHRVPTVENPAGLCAIHHVQDDATALIACPGENHPGEMQIVSRSAEGGGGWRGERVIRAHSHHLAAISISKTGDLLATASIW